MDVHRKFRTTACALLASVAAASYGARASAGDAPRYEGTWRIRYDSSDRIDLEFAYRRGFSTGDESRTVRYSQSGIAGVTLDSIEHTSGDERFSVVRDAGSFDCRGHFQDGTGSGTFVFTPSEEYADALAARGIGRPSGDDAFRLAFSDVTLAYVDALRTAGISGVTIDGLDRLSDHGVDAPFVGALRAAGVGVSSVDDLVELRDHGVDAAFVDGLRDLGFRFGASDLVRLRDHGVDVDYAAGLKKLGYAPSADELVRLRDHGVDLAFVQRLAAHGYHPSVDDLIRLHDSGI